MVDVKPDDLQRDTQHPSDFTVRQTFGDEIHDRPLVDGQNRQNVIAERGDSIGFVTDPRQIGPRLFPPQGLHQRFRFGAHRNRAASTGRHCPGKIAAGDSSSEEHQPGGKAFVVHDGEDVGGGYICEPILQ
jgi:hypothetical protein